MLQLSSYHEAPLTLEGQSAILLIKRLGFDEAEAYRRKLQWFLGAPALRAPNHLDGTPPTPEEAEAFSRQLDDELTAFASASIGAYVAVKPGQILLDGVEITTGLDVLRAFCGAPSVVLALLLGIGAKNEVSAHEKKAWRSLFGLANSSPAPEPEADGPTPDATAPSAEPATSVANATAPASPERTPSGPPETSS